MSDKEELEPDNDTVPVVSLCRTILFLDLKVKGSRVQPRTSHRLKLNIRTVPWVHHPLFPLDVVSGPFSRSGPWVISHIVSEFMDFTILVDSTPFSCSYGCYRFTTPR